jgi:hypothetical protein
VKANRRYGYGEFEALIFRVLPDWLWATPLEILAMLEFIDDEIEFHNLRITLFRMFRNGKLEKRRYTAERANGAQFKRK